jgi:hypothetical protein
MLVKNGIQCEDADDGDVYSMLLPGETDNMLGSGKRGSSGLKKGSHLRSPFEEGHVYDNKYEFQHMQKSGGEQPNAAELNFPLTCSQCHK